MATLIQSISSPCFPSLASEGEKSRGCLGTSSRLSCSIALALASAVTIGHYNGHRRDIQNTRISAVFGVLLVIQPCPPPRLPFSASSPAPHIASPDPGKKNPARSAGSVRGNAHPPARGRAYFRVEPALAKRPIDRNVSTARKGVRGGRCGETGMRVRQSLAFPRALPNTPPWQVKF
jgi:hypothetical protein